MGFYSCCHAKVNISPRAKKEENLGQKDSRQAPRLLARPPSHGQGKEKGLVLPIISSSDITCSESPARGSHRIAGDKKRSRSLCEPQSPLGMLIQPPAVTRSSPAPCTQGSRLKSPRPPRGWFGKTQSTSRKPIVSGLISKCFHSGGGKHSPHLLIMFFFPVIFPFFSLLFFHFLQTSFIILLIFSPFYIIHLSLLVLGVGSANCCNFPKLHQL